LTKENPIISVIMPVYNSQDTVYHSVKSVLNQTYKNFEFIIVNDGSTDKSEDIILSFQDERIKYFKTKHKGRSSASNYGISKAAGEYVARIDSDDMFFPDKMTKQMKYIELHPETDVIFCWSIFYEDKGPLRFWRCPESDTKIKYRLMYLNPINHSSVVCKKSMLLEIHGYDEKLDVNEDYDLWIRARKQSKFYCMQEYLVFSLKKEDDFKKKYNNDLKSLLIRNIDNVYTDNDIERNNLSGRVEFYYGNKDDARNLLLRGDVFRNIKLLIFSLIPGSYLNVLRGKKLSLLLSTELINYSSYKNNLKQMLNG